MCSRANAGKRLTQQIVVTGAEGGLANAFVQLEGSSAGVGRRRRSRSSSIRKGASTRRASWVRRRARRCGSSTATRCCTTCTSPTAQANEFDITQPQSGMVFNHTLKKDDTMLRLGLHGPLVDDGLRRRRAASLLRRDRRQRHVHASPGCRRANTRIQIWHERYGKLTKTIEVTAGGTATINFDYTGGEAEKPTGR